MKKVFTAWFPFFLGLLFFIAILRDVFFTKKFKEEKESADKQGWHIPDINLVPHTPEGDLIRYGRELIVNTSKYLGPKGIVAPITNGMNCQNCHVEAGTKLPINSFFYVASSYPRFRERSGRDESIEFRVNDCLIRSLNGKTIDSLSTEMRAIVAYLKWLGKDVKKGEVLLPAPKELLFLDRAADPEKGKIIFQDNCQRCHQSNGQGVLYPDSTEYRYPPLWGANSFNTAAGMYRISRLATFIKYNMPFDLTVVSPKLNDEESWDVAAYICSQQRPEKNFPEDWPNITFKPIDFPFGPYPDAFSQQQHKYGPFPPIKNADKETTKPKDNH